jgi:hypothetical protein
MNNRMLKTRGRKRHARSTRKKCINCTNWKERRPCKREKRTTRRSNKHKKHSARMRGGRSDEPTVKTVDGMPVTKDAIVSIPGYGTIGVEQFKKHEEYEDFQGEGGTPGYD